MFDFLTLLSLFRNERSEKAHWGDESKQKKLSEMLTQIKMSYFSHSSILPQKKFVCLKPVLLGERKIGLREA